MQRGGASCRRAPLVPQTRMMADEFSLRSCVISQIAFVSSVVCILTTTMRRLLLQPRHAAAVLTLAFGASPG